MYRPNFCAECGERVVRARWHWWTSRRFCLPCGRRLRKRRIAAKLALCATVFGAGLMLGGRMRTPQPPLLVVERGGTSVEPSSVSGEPPAPSGGEGQERRAGGASVERHGADGTSTERPTDPSEIVSICGARTQKGTPCQRRVRGTGRCWQHRGKAAMLPSSKLVVP